MAELTATLPEVQDRAQVIADPAYSGVGDALRALASGINSFDNAWTERSNRKAREAAAARQAREDQYKEFERSVKSGATSAAFDISSGRYGAGLQNNAALQANPNLGNNQGTPFSEELDGVPRSTITNAALASAKDLSRFQAAADQGKLPPISLRAQVDLKYQELIAQYGDKAGPIIAEQFKALGIDSAFLHSLKDDIGQQESFAKAQQKALGDALEAGLKYTNPEVAKTMTREQLVAVGLDQMRLDHEQEQVKRGLEIAGLKQTQTIQEKEFDDKEADQRNYNLGVQRGKSVLSQLINLGQQASDAAGPAGTNPARESQLTGMMDRMRQQLPTVVENVISSLNIKDAASVSRLREELTSYYKNTFLTPWEENRKAVGTALKAVQDNIGLKTSEAMPLLTQLKAAGVPYEAMGPMFDSIARNLGMQDRLRAEIMNYDSILQKDPFGTTAQAQLATIVSLMKGNETLASLEARDPRSAAAAVHAMKGTISGLQRGISTGEYSDPNTKDTYLNALGVVVTAANKVNHQSGIDVLGEASFEIAHPHNIGAINALMKDPQFADEAKIIGQGLRAQSARLLESFKRLPAADPYWNVLYDKKQGRYVAKFNEGAWNRDNGDAAKMNTFMLGQSAPALQVGTATPRPTKPPQIVLNKLDRVNGLLNFLASTTEWDDRALKGTPIEVKNFFAVNEPTEAMKKQAKSNQGPVNTDAEFNKLVTKVDAALEQARQPLIPPSEVLPDAAEIRAALPKDYQENFSIVQEAANRQGVPIDMAARLIKQESGFNSEAKSGKGAIGLGQIVPKSWNDVAQTRYGKTVDQLNARENADLSMWILQSLYRKYGNWQDAVSAYHSGRPMAQSASASDGNMKTHDYVRGIVG